MDYYAGWPAWKMPKWVGIALGGAFSVIAVGSAWLIVDLTRPPRARPGVVATAGVAAPKTAELARSPAQLPPARPEQAARLDVPPRAEKSVAKRSRELSPARKRAILAKRDTKSARQTKSDLDRLLGL